MMQQEEKIKEYPEANDSPLNTEEILSILNKTKEENFLKENKIFENLSAEFKSFSLEEIAKKNNSNSSGTKNIDQKLQVKSNEPLEIENKNILEPEKACKDKEEIKKLEKIYTQEQHENLINDAKENSFKEGIQKGFEQGEKNIKNELQKGEQAHTLALKNTIDNLFHVAPEFSKKLNQTINKTIIDICDQVLGYKISEMPEKFLKKINDLVSSIENSSNKIIVFLNAEDQKVLNEFIKNNKTLTDITFKADETLQRGDLIIKSGGIEINDISSQKFDLISDSDIEEKLKELANENYAEIQKAKISDVDQDSKAQIKTEDDKTLLKNENIQSKLKTQSVKTQLSENSNISSDSKSSEKTNDDSNLKEKLSNEFDKLGDEIKNQKIEKENHIDKIENSPKKNDTLMGD